MVTNRKLLLPYAAPYFAYVFIASVAKDHISMESNYIVRLILVAALLVWAARWYFPVTGPKSVSGSIAAGVVAGILGFLLWIALLAPFAGTVDNAPWTTRAFVLRLISAGLLVPVFEELFIRGYVFRFALQWGAARKADGSDPFQQTLDGKSVNDVDPGAWSWTAVIVSTVIFASGHHLYEWLAAVGFSGLMIGLWIYRKDLVSCIVAHSVTNIALALFVMTTGRWNFW